MDRVDYQSFIIQDLLNDHRDKKLNLNPWYQRRSVWTPPQKSYLMNTLFERKPMPAIYIRHTIDIDNQRSVKEVVDGQQRSRTVIDYCDNKFSARIEQSGQRKFYRDLTPSERDKLLLTPLPVGFLLGATDEDVIDIFARINSVSKTLNAQEKRNAKYSGEFKQFCLHFASSKLSFWRNANIFTANNIARMDEVQFVSDLVFNFVNGLSDFKPQALTQFYEDNDLDFPSAPDVFDQLTPIFDLFISLDEGVFKDTIFSRPPILFSLIMCLKENPRKLNPEISDCLYSIDAEFNDENNQAEDVAAFRQAVSSTTQRLKSRSTRHEFLSSRI